MGTMTESMLAIWRLVKAPRAMTRRIGLTCVALFAVLSSPQWAAAQTAGNSEFRAGVAAGLTVEPMVVGPPGTAVSVSIFCAYFQARRVSWFDDLSLGSMYVVRMI